MKSIFLVFTMMVASASYTQSEFSDFDFKVSGRTLVDTLASGSFYGRGYVNDGVQLAADFIENYFAVLGLEKPDQLDGYRDNFLMPVNTFPGRAEVKIADQVLSAGTDFQIEPASPGIKGRFTLQVLSPIQLLNGFHLEQKKQRKKLIGIRSSEIQQLENAKADRVREILNEIKQGQSGSWAGIVYFQKEKLTWSGADTLFPVPVITIRENEVVSRLVDEKKSLKATVHIDQHFFPDYPSSNIIAKINGKSDSSGQSKSILISAHYDHLGQFGSTTIYPGANDNASGTALVLSLAKYYTLFPEELPTHNLIFALFAGEEVGLKGSASFVLKYPDLLQDLRFVINLDICGTGEDGIQVVNGTFYENEMRQLVSLNREQKLLENIKTRGSSCNSDHCPFHLQGVPSFFMYTLGGVRHYHDIMDRPETLPLTEFEDLSKLIILFIDSFEAE